MLNMLTELKRCNSVGDVAGLLFLAGMLHGKQYVIKKEIANRCALENSIKINCTGAMAFFEYLGYVEDHQDRLIPTAKFEALSIHNKDSFIKQTVSDCVSALTNDGLFNKDSTCYDIEKDHLCIKRSAFPLAYAAIRNYLTTVGVLDKEENGEIGINSSYESDFSELLRKHHNTLTLNQLLEKQRDQSERGLLAEEFVLRLEKSRVSEKANHIKRISDFDVSAGFDIVSFETNNSMQHDRFIEVKCFLGEPHFFWSENEVDVAKIKGDKYYLCLVDYQKMVEDSEYMPTFIKNPYSIIFNDSSWIVNTSSYRVKKI